MKPMLQAGLCWIMLSGAGYALHYDDSKTLLVNLACCNQSDSKRPEQVIEYKTKVY